MMILAIETAVENVGIALGDHRGVLASTSLTSDRRHCESLTPMIKFACNQSGLELSQLGAVAVDIGPGLFTGMRVGIASAQMLAWALDIPVIGVCSLDALAVGSPHGEDDVIASVLDARRGEVYWSVYRNPRETGRFPERLTEPTVSSPEDLVIHLNEREQYVSICGSGAVRYSEEMQNVTRSTVHGVSHAFPTATSVLQLAIQKASREEWNSADSLEPMYLREPDAEINWATRSGG